MFQAVLHLFFVSSSRQADQIGSESKIYSLEYGTIFVVFRAAGRGKQQKSQKRHAAAGKFYGKRRAEVVVPWADCAFCIF
jgi:hypothetical protein